MKTTHTILNLPEQGEILNEIVADKEHEIISVSLSSTSDESVVKHFALVVWLDKDDSEHWHVGSTPGRTYSK
ncbi:MAG: hypothetical protein QGH94_17905 [Phycisphaerae bacterium]|jgi:hypothetical protein|nr:hypothetical protein [Phycisphaerae bacterium]MDP7289860.1 hypothetical protein [Phycisphaerae bacterium]